MSDLVPFDPICQRYARDMPELDWDLEEDETREEFILENEGTLNPSNGHFLCNECYIKAGMPSSEFGWRCP